MTLQKFKVDADTMEKWGKHKDLKYHSINSNTMFHSYQLILVFATNYLCRLTITASGELREYHHKLIRCNGTIL